MKSRLHLISFASLAFLCVVAYSLLYPALNWPDEAYKFAVLDVDSNIYLRVLSFLKGDECFLRFTTLPYSKFGSNILTIHLIDQHKCYYKIKLINSALIIILVIAALSILKYRKDKALFIHSIIWPSSMFYLTGVNQQVVFHLASILITILAIRYGRIPILFFVSISLIYVDRSFVSLSIFLIYLFSLKWNPKIAPLLSAVFVMLFFILKPYIGAMTLFFMPDVAISDITQSVSHLSDGFIFSFALLLLSMVYLGGTATIIGIGPEYIIVPLVMTYFLCKNYRDKEMLVFLAAGLLTFVTVVSFVPTLQTFRYYVFMTPILVNFLIPAGRGYFILGCYSIIMQFVYILQAMYLST